MMDFMMLKNRKLKFFKHAETTRGGRRVIKMIRCEINKEMVVYLSFCPPIPESGPNGETSVVASPMTPCTPTSPAFFHTLSSSTKRTSTRNKQKQRLQQQRQQQQQQYQQHQQQQILLLKKKKEDMLTKAKLAAEEATKIEMEELKQRLNEAKEQGKEQELAKMASLQVTKYMQRIAVFPLQEQQQQQLGAWSTSKHQLFQLISLHARKAMTHFIQQYPETAFYHLFVSIRCFFFFHHIL
jgi:hypothetical protein